MVNASIRIFFKISKIFLIYSKHLRIYIFQLKNGALSIRRKILVWISGTGTKISGIFRKTKISLGICYLPELSVSVNSGIFVWVVQLSAISVFSDNVPRNFFMKLIALMYSETTMPQNGVAEHRCFLVSQFMQSSSLGSSPSRGHASCSWARHLTHTVPLHPGV